MLNNVFIKSFYVVLTSLQNIIAMMEFKNDLGFHRIYTLLTSGHRYASAMRSLQCNLLR